MTKSFLLFVALFATATVAGCTPPEDQYPISGEECTAEDPVKDLDASDLNCIPAA